MALKTYNPTSPSMRQLVTVDRSELQKGKPVKKLTEGLHSSGGRNNHGRTTMRFRGGGHKRTYRLVDFKRAASGAWRLPSSGWSTTRTARRSSRWSSTRTASSPTSWPRSGCRSATR